ncbi:MAG: hypothetical protein ACI9C1_003763 [Candidatus Aldehydirespiratoraceae bacterium]|jgi:hypothetical protein
MHVVVDQASAVRTGVVAEMDRLGVWQGEGAKSAGGWLRCRALRPGDEASRSIRRARRLREASKLSWSFDQGRIGETRVDAVLRVCNERTAELFERDEDMLVGFAETLRYDKLLVALQRWLQLADTDGPDPDAKEFAARRFSLSKTLEGTWQSEGFWDRVSGSELSEAVRREADRLFKKEWAEAEERLGRPPILDELERTPGQRRADALLALVRRGAATAEGGARPLINIIVGLDTLLGPVAELLDGTILSPGTVARHLLESHIRSLVFESPQKVLRISSKSRFFSGRLRDAIEIRDRECQHKLCDEPAARCDVDHLIPWPEGQTSEANGDMKCGFHNRKKGHRRGERMPRDG